MLFHVHQRVVLNVSIQIEADTKEEAEDKADITKTLISAVEKPNTCVVSSVEVTDAYGI